MADKFCHVNAKLFGLLIDNLRDNPEFGHYLAELSSYGVDRLSECIIFCFFVVILAYLM